MPKAEIESFIELPFGHLLFARLGAADPEPTQVYCPPAGQSLSTQPLVAVRLTIELAWSFAALPIYHQSPPG
jgi:hypothetical protein